MRAAIIILTVLLSPLFARPVQAQSATSPASASPAANPPAPLLPDPVAEALRGGPESWTSPERLSSTLQVMLLLTVLSLAPAILLMTTSFVRIVVVLGLLATGDRHAAASAQPGDHHAGHVHDAAGHGADVDAKSITTASALYARRDDRSRKRPGTPASCRCKRFMSRQIDLAGNSDDVWLFLRVSAREPANAQAARKRTRTCRWSCCCRRSCSAS